MHNSTFWFVVLVLAVLTGGCAEGPDTTGPPQEVPTTTEQSPELKVLQRLVGSWEHQVVKKPEETKMTGTATMNWILRGRMLEHKIIWSPGDIHFAKG